MKILGFSHGSHDSSYCIYEDGKLLVHEELERLNRVKETDGDILEYLFQKGTTFDDFDYITTYPHGELKWYSPTFVKEFDRIKDKFIEVGHHTSHAANAYFTSGFGKSLVFTLDGGGWDRLETGMIASSATAWIAEGGEIQPLRFSDDCNLGWIWSQATSVVFKMSGGGPPYGCQAGTVMGMSAYGNANNFKHIDKDFLSKCDFSTLSELNEQEQFDFAARLQQLTEEIIYDLLKPYIDQYEVDSVCLSGGVALNCVMTGKISSWFPKIKNIYIPPVPYDAGLAIGCAQYVYHQLLSVPVDTKDLQNSPYLGIDYSLSDIMDTLSDHSDKVEFKNSSDSEICELLKSESIISLFNGKSESGRRALGNRSIIADPRSNDIRAVVNHKTKHRQWFRPFAPSVLEAKVGDWFTQDVFSPYMSFAIPFKEEKKAFVPAVVHKDGTGRLQTVSEKLNPRYHQLISEWERQTGIPIVLNTSFNDKEPIVETPEDALKCFLKTKIDYLYFMEHNLLISKK